jgi:hypothetical protein
MLSRVSSVFFAMTSAHTNPFYRSWKNSSPPSLPRWQTISG